MKGYTSTICFLFALLFLTAAGGHFVFRWCKKIESKIWYPVARCSELSFDVGQTRSDESREHAFTISNVGSADLVIQKITAGCGSCVTVVAYTKEPVPPGKTGTIVLRLLTQQLHGKVKKEVLVKTNDPRNPELMLTLEAEIIPKEKQDTVNENNNGQ